MMADGEQIHSAMYPGSIFGDLFTEQTEVNVRQHALESACFVVCAAAWLNAGQQAQIAQPVLVVNGKNNMMVPTINSYALFQQLPNARLTLYRTPVTARCSSTLTRS
jgi:fermentation-respiration switch protein FrsA (DUF1100 family)